MKTVLRKIISFCLLIISTANLYSQITIKEEIKKEVIIEQPINKPEKYDSLSPWDFDEYNLSNNKRNIGLQIYLKPDFDKDGIQFLYSMKPSVIKNSSNNSNFTYYYNPKFALNKFGDYYICSDLSNDSNYYFTIIDVLIGTRLTNTLKKMRDTLDSLKNNKDGILVPEFEILFRSYYNGSDPYLMFLLKNNKTNDSLLMTCTEKEHNKFISVPYFLTQKKIFEKETLIYQDLKRSVYFPESFVYKDAVNLVEFEDNNGFKKTKPKEVVVPLNSKWFCSDVTLLKPYYDLCYILNNDKGDQIIFGSSYQKGELEDFVNEKDFLKMEAEKKMQKQQLYLQQQKEKNAKETKEKLEIEKHKAKCISLFGKENGELIAQGKIKIGMTTENCIYAWGEPFNKRKSITESAVTEIWNYWAGYQLFFINGVLKRIDKD